MVHINGVLYSCGGYTANGESKVCYKYDLASNSSSWENFMVPTGVGDQHPAVAFPTYDFFWYLSSKILQVPVNGGNTTSFDIELGNGGCAVGNGSHSVFIGKHNSSVLMNSDPLSPNNWTKIANIKTSLFYGGCLWLGNTIYVTGGFSSDTFKLISKTQLINTDTFEVTLGADVPIQVASHAMGIIDGNPAVFGGHNGGSPLSTIYVYDSATNTWSLSDRSLPQAAMYSGAVTFYLSNDFANC